MSRNSFIFAIVGFAIINGMFSPLLPQALGAVLIMGPAFFATSISILFFFASILLATLTIMVAGVPAALYERATGASDSTQVSMWIWLACSGVLTLPAIIQFLDVGFSPPIGTHPLQLGVIGARQARRKCFQPRPNAP